MDRKAKIAELLASKGQLACVSLPEDRILFVLNDCEVGHLPTKEANTLAANFRFFDLSKGVLNFSAESSDQASRRLATVSHFYKATNQVFAWRDELLPIVPMNDFERKHVLGTIERAMCRPFAFSTFAVHLNPFAPDGRLWVAQRSKKKAIGPGFWDNCAAGMVPFDEDFDTAMQREAFEEAGIHPGSLNFRYRSRHLISRPVHEGWMREHTLIFSAEVPADFRPHNVDGEVEKFELLEPEEILERIQNHRFTFESSLSVLIGLAEREGLPTELEAYI